MRQWLVDARKKKGLTQKDASKLSGVSQPAFCNYEHKKTNPTVPNAKRIGKVLGIDWTKFFEDK